VGAIKVLDNNNNTRQIAFDNISGTWYWISTYDGPAGSQLSTIFTDKADINGANGTEIEPVLWLGGDTGTLEHFFIQHKETHLYCKPNDENNRGVTGYDANGYRTGLQVGLYMFADRNPTTEKYKTLNVPKDGDIHFQWDDNPEVNVAQLKIVANRSELVLTGILSYYFSVNHASADTKRTMQESTLQETTDTAVLSLGRVYGVLTNLLNLQPVVPGTFAWAADPQGDATAISFTVPLTIGSITLVGGSIFLWTNGTVALSIGGTVVPLTAYGAAIGNWTLRYATGITASGNVVITPTGSAV
jgi:hypothetical protein